MIYLSSSSYEKVNPRIEKVIFIKPKKVISTKVENSKKVKSGKSKKSNFSISKKSKIENSKKVISKTFEDLLVELSELLNEIKNYTNGADTTR